MTVTIPANFQNSHHQYLGDLRMVAPNSNVIVKDAMTGDVKRIEDQYGQVVSPEPSWHHRNNILGVK